MSAMRAFAAIVLAIVTGQAARTLSEPALQQTPAFKTGVDLVQVDVSVLDRDRHPIRGLTSADFTVLESATAGTYRLRIVATRDTRQASRDVRFVVEPARRPPS